MDLAWRTLKNSIYSILEFGWPILTSLLATPYIVHRLGSDAYGVFALVSVTVSFVGMLDLGMGAASIRFIAEHYENGDFEGINRALATVLAFYCMVGAAGIVLLVALTHPLVTRVLSVPPQLVTVAEFAFYIAAPGFLVNLVLGTFSSIPKAIQRYDISTKANVIIGTISVAANVAVLYLGYGLGAVVVAGVLVNALALPAYYVIDRGLIPSLRLRLSFDGALFRELFSFGGFFLVAQLGSALLYQLDKLLIGSFLGVGLVTYYVVPGNLAQKIQLFLAAAVAVVFPVSAALFASGRHDALQRLYREGYRLTFVLATMIAVPMAVFADKFLRFWMGPDFAARSTPVMVMLVATYYLLGLTGVPWGMAFGSGRARINAFFAVGTAVLDIVAFLLLVRPFGLNGAALAYLLSAMIGAPVLISFIERRVVGLSGVEFLRLFWRPGLVGVLQVAVALLCRPLMTSLAATLILMVAVAAAYPALYVALGFMEEGDRQLLSMLIRRFRPEPADQVEE